MIEKTMNKLKSKINDKLILFLLGVVLLAALPGCRSDLSLPQPDSGHRSGVSRVGSSLSVAPTEAALRTKSAFSGDEAKVSNWTLLQFDASGGLLAAAYFQPSAADLHGIEVVTGHAYDWYAIANVGDVRSQFTVGTSTASAMEAWFATGFDMRTASGIPMAWKGEGIAFSKPDLAAGRKLEVSLTRLVACYDIAVDKSALRKYAFQVSAATLEGPASVRPFSESRGTDVATTTDAASPADVGRLNSGAAVRFFAAENCYGNLPISDPDSKKPARLSPGDHPTFIEISGTATLLDGSGLTFPARYRFYLGTNATSNFDVIRNTENTVTLRLSDAKLDAARDERDAIDAGRDPSDPLWKVEVDPYDDPRGLQFRHGLAAGGTGIRLSPGGCTGEDVTRFPAGLSYQFRLDQVLYDAGIRVYLDEAATRPLLPASGYAEASWVTAEGRPGTLYFQLPAGSPLVEGQAHIRTLDGRKSDDLPISGGRMLDHLTLDPAKTYILAPGQYPSYKLYAHFTDGSSEDITEDALVSWTGGRHIRYRDPYNTGYEFWMYPRAGTHMYADGKRSFQWFRKNINGNYSWSPYNTYPEVTASVPQVLFTASWTCNGVSRSVDELGVITKEAASLSVSPETFSLLTGQTVSLAASVRFTDGSTADVTASAVWNNDAEGCLTNVGGGRYTGLSVGTTTVTASYGGLSSNAASITVQARTVSSVRLQVRNPATGQWGTGDQTVSLGSDQQWRLSVLYADSTTPETVTSGFELVRTTDNGAVSIRSDRITTHADAIGTDTFKASFGGVTSANSVKLTVQNHNYTYRLLVGTRSSGTYEQILADASAAVDLAWNESQVFYAWYVRLDNGAFDRMEDISSSASWNPDAALVAANVGSWNSGLQQYVANNTSGAAVSGNLEASYNGISACAALSVASYKAPYLRIVEDGPLTWDCWAYGPSGSKTFHVESNVAWTMNGSTAGWHVSRSSGNGNYSITVYPESQNFGDDNDVTLTVTANSDPSLTDSIELKQDGKEGRGRNKLWWTVSVSPAAKEMTVGSTFDRFTATLQAYRDGARTQPFGSPADVSDTAEYIVETPSVASVISVYGGSTTGRATALAAGTTKVTVWWLRDETMLGGYPREIPATATITVVSGDVTSYRIVTAVSSSSIAWNGTATASATLQSSTNGGAWANVRDVTGQVTFSSDKPVVSVSGRSLTAANESASSVMVTISSSAFTGSETIESYESADLEVDGKPAPVDGSLSVSPDELAWEWDESGSGDGKRLAVTATDCEIASIGVTSGFSYSRSGNTLRVWPDVQNTSTTADKPGTLTVSGTNGAADVTVRLTQAKKPAPVLMDLAFDRTHYELVQVSGGEVHTVQTFTLTARYSDGSTADVTAVAVYADQGAVTVSAAAGTLTATAACSDRRLTATFGGQMAAATYSAEDLEVPVGIELAHFESQEDSEREFVISAVEATLRQVLSGAVRTMDVTDAVNIKVDGPVVSDPPVDGMRLFHFTAAGSGSLTFTFTWNAVPYTRILDVSCSPQNHIRHSWR